MACEDGCAVTCVKYLLFIFNAIFCICGLALLAIGIWVRFDDSLGKHLGEDTVSVLYSGAYVIIAVGAFIAVTTFLGCCGAIRESQCMLFCFFILLLVLFIALIAIGIFVYVKRDSIEEEIDDFINEQADKGYDGDVEKYNATMELEEEFECCINATRYKSCAANPGKELCSEKIWDTVEHNAAIVGGIAIGVALILLLGMIFSLRLCCFVRNKSNYNV